MTSYKRLSINIGIIGCVSTGKSTLNNALLLNQYSDMKIKRTTMLPQVYCETTNKSILKSARQINEETSQSNKEIIEKTEKGKQLTIEECVELKFYINKIEHFDILKKDIMFTIYDIPGLNDARTKNIYYQYLKENFYKFDIILFVIDINSALNTSDEIDILNFLAENMNEMKSKGKNIYLIPIANKCDEMEIVNNIPHIKEEHSEMFDQITNHINEVAEKKKMTELFKNVLPLCACDAFLFRMLQKNRDYQLNSEQVKKIGHNHMGYKFSKMTKEEQVNKLSEIMNETDFINNMVERSGFHLLENELRKLLTKQCQTEMLGNSLMYELKNAKIPKVDELSKELIKLEKILKVGQVIDKMTEDLQFITFIGNMMITHVEKCLESCKFSFEETNADSYNVYELKKYLEEIVSIELSTVSKQINEICEKYIVMLNSHIFENVVGNILEVTTINKLLEKVKSLEQNKLPLEKIDEFINRHIENYFANILNEQSFMTYIENSDLLKIESQYIEMFIDFYSLNTTLDTFSSLVGMVICMKYKYLLCSNTPNCKEIYKSMLFLDIHKTDDIIFRKLSSYLLLSSHINDFRLNIFGIEYDPLAVKIENYLANVIRQNKSESES